MEAVLAPPLLSHFTMLFLGIDSTFRFLVEKWKDQLPPGYLLKDASVDPPFEEDACCCHFNFIKDKTESSDSELVLKYQWFVGERTPSNFKAIPNATGEVIGSCCVFSS